MARVFTGKDGILTPLVKQLANAALQAEQLGGAFKGRQGLSSNRRNGAGRKTIKSIWKFRRAGCHEIGLAFEPQLVKKHQTQFERRDRIQDYFNVRRLGMSYLEKCRTHLGKATDLDDFKRHDQRRH